MEMDAHLHCLLLLIVFVPSVMSEGTAVLQGDLHLAGMFQIFNDEHCTEEVDEMSVRNFEAVKWTIQKLNEVNYIPGITLGLEGFPTCNVRGRALEHTTRIMKRRFNDPADPRLTPIIGLIGPEYSHEAMDTSSYISSFGKNNLLLQTLFSTTASALSDNTKYQNILRVVPEDRKQTSVIVSLMESLAWNYIGVVYENNSYGVGNYQELKKLTKTREICIASESAISVENGIVSSEQLQKAIDSLIYRSESRILGVVVFASTNTAKVLLNIASKLRSQTSFRLGMIFSEGSSDIGTKTLENLLIAKGAFYSSPPWLHFESFRVHWQSVLTNKTVFNQETISNPWLLNVLKKSISCDVRDASCSMPKTGEIETDFNVYEGYAILATILHAKILKDLHLDSCGGNNGLCSEMNSTLTNSAYKLIDRGRKTQVNGTNTPKDLNIPIAMQFTDTVDARMTGNKPEYEVYHFRKCVQKIGEWCLELIGEYNNKTLSLKTELLRDYTEDEENALAWPNIIQAQCEVGKTCQSCQHNDLASEIIFKKGDLYVGAVVPVYDKDNDDPLKCSAIRTSNGWEVVEGIRFAVETANAKLGSFTNFFGNKQIGYIILNSCNQPLLIQLKLLKLFKEGLQWTDGSQISDLRNKTLGFVGAYGSSISQAVARTIQEFNFPQISYASTAAVLSNRSMYKYFLRTCTPDNKQARAMLNIVKTLNSSYIQIVYSKGTYGEGGRNAIVDVAKEFKICVANEIEVIETQYKKIRDDLNKTPYATVVLLFLKSHVVSDVMTELHETIKPWSYLFIGSEAFGSRMDVISNKPNLEGTITLSLQMKPLTGNSKFEKYLFDRLSSLDNDINRWTKDYFEKKKSCYLAGSFDKKSGSKCSDIAEEYNNKDYQPELWTSFAINAMFALLYGSKEAFDELCGSQYPDLCQKYRNSPETVYNRTKDVKLVIDDTGVSSRVFDDFGDGNIGYRIYQVQTVSDTSQLTFVEIGRYTLHENGYSIYEKTIKDPFKILPSKCPNPPECQKCIKQSSIQTNSPTSTRDEGNSIVPIILGALLGVSVLALIVVSIVLCLVCRGCKRPNESLYLSPHFSHGHQTPETEDSGYFANPLQGESEQPQHIEMYQSRQYVHQDTHPAS